MYKFLIAVLFLGFSNTFAQQTKIDSVAERMLYYQRSYGGWPKAVNDKKVVYDKPLTDKQIKEAKQGINDDDGTIDNKATTREIRHLVTAYKQTGNKNYLDAAQKGLDYLLKAQYANGGWPQYFPKHNLYRGQITYNDNAIVNVLTIFQDIIDKAKDFDVVNASYLPKATEAVAKGVSCILKTQVRVNGELTIWAAQYDQNTLQPAKARAFEPASLSSAESVEIVRFLMRLPNPSAEIKSSIKAAMQWFDKAKIKGIATKEIADASKPKGKDLVVVEDPASVLWARFYELETFKPIFIGRDEVIRYNIAEIDYERRNGYAWYGTWAQKLFDREYPKWSKKIGE